MTFRLLSLGRLFLASLPLSLLAQITVDQHIPAVAAINVDASPDAGARHHIFPHESVTAITFHKAT